MQKWVKIKYVKNTSPEELSIGDLIMRKMLIKRRLKAVRGSRGKF